MNQIRFSSLHNTNSYALAGFDREVTPTNPNANQGSAGEFVFNSLNDTFASLEEPRSLSSLMADRDMASSFIAIA